MTSSYLDQLCKDPILKYSHILRSWRLGLRHINLGNGDTNQPITASFKMVIFTSPVRNMRVSLDSLPSEAAGAPEGKALEIVGSVTVAPGVTYSHSCPHSASENLFKLPRELSSQVMADDSSPRKWNLAVTPGSVCLSL